MQIDRVRLIAEMARQNIGNRELAARARVSEVTISMIRNGKRCYSRTAEKITDALGVSLAYLRGIEESPGEQ